MSRPFRSLAVAMVAASGIALMTAGAAPAIAAPATAVARSATPVVTVVASGLNDPKEVTLGPGGLYVAESGTGGSSCVTIAGTSYCEGQTGAIVLVNGAGTRTVLSGLPSVVNSAEGTLGPACVTFIGGKLGVLFQDTAVNSDGTTSVVGPESNLFGKLALAAPFSSAAQWTAGPDVAGFAAANPQNAATLGGVPGGETTYDSDPYDIIPYRGGWAIADAAANDVLWLSPGGSLSVIDRLPTVPETVPAGVFGPSPVTIDAQAVPTSLAVGPDGALYAGTLPGFPANAGTASIYRLVPGQTPAVVATGLTEVSSIAFDQGRLLALEFNTAGGLGAATVPGPLAEVGPGGTVSTLPVSGLNEPTGLAVGPGGAVYVATSGNGAAGTGEVVKITGLDLGW